MSNRTFSLIAAGGAVLALVALPFFTITGIISLNMSFADALLANGFPPILSLGFNFMFGALFIVSGASLLAMGNDMAGHRVAAVGAVIEALCYLSFMQFIAGYQAESIYVLVGAGSGVWIGALSAVAIVASWLYAETHKPSVSEGVPDYTWMLK